MKLVKSNRLLFSYSGELGYEVNIWRFQIAIKKFGKGRRNYLHKCAIDCMTYPNIMIISSPRKHLSTYIWLEK